jgi:hypothetical protein
MPRFEIRSLMIAVGVAAIGLAILRLEVLTGAYILAVSFVFVLWSLILQKPPGRSINFRRETRRRYNSLQFYVFAVAISVAIIVGFVLTCVRFAP